MEEGEVMYSFKRLIKKYSKYPVYLLEESEGYYDIDKGNLWIPGQIEEILIESGAVVPLSNDDLEYGEGGTYTAEDKKLYCYQEIKKGAKVKHKNKDYTVMESRNYVDFDVGLYIYFIKRGDRDD